MNREEPAFRRLRSASKEAKNRRGAGPVHYAVDGIPGSPSWNPRAQAATVVCLLEAGADPKAVDAGGVTPLHRAGAKSLRRRGARAARGRSRCSVSQQEGNAGAAARGADDGPWRRRVAGSQSRAGGNPSPARWGWRDSVEPAGSAEAGVVGGVLDGAGVLGGAERREGVEHDGQLVGGAGADALFVGTGVRAVDDAGGVVREAPDADPLARGEVAARVEDDLVAVDRRMRVGAGDRLRVEVERAWDEATDERAARGEGAVHRRRQVGEADPRAEVQDRKDPGVDGAVPADHVERRVRQPEAVKGAAALDHQLAQPLVARAGEERAAKVSVAVRRVHPQLADLVAPLFEEAKAGGAFDRQPVLRLLVRDEAVGEPFGDEEVVVRPEGEIAEGRAQEAAAGEDEVEIVAVAVREIDRVGLVGVEDGEDDVVVEQQRHPGVDGGASPSPQLLREIVPARQRVRLVVGVGGDLPAVYSGDGHARVRALEVVHDGERPIEPAAREALLVPQPAAAVAQRRVRLVGNHAGHHAIEHRASFCLFAYLARACSRSIASNRARKFPAPNPLSPLRWMISKKNGPASGS